MRQWSAYLCGRRGHSWAHIRSCRAAGGDWSGQWPLRPPGPFEEQREVDRLVTQPRLGPSAISNRDRARASAAYVIRSEVCYQELYSSPIEYIDDGGLWESGDGTREFRTSGDKVGPGIRPRGG